MDSPESSLRNPSAGSLPFKIAFPFATSTRTLHSMSLLKVGLIGTIVAAVCCFTPVLVILLGAVGLASLVGYLDYVLLPSLAASVAIVGIGMYKRQKS